jgi:hypothetical protein
MTYQDAKSHLDSMGLTLGSVARDPDVKDTTGAFVYRQVPGQFNEDRKLNAIHPGQTIDIFLGTEAKLRSVDSTRNAAQPPPAEPTQPGTN